MGNNFPSKWVDIIGFDEPFIEMDFAHKIISGSARTLKIITGIEVISFLRFVDRFWLIFSVQDNFYFVFSLRKHPSYTEFAQLE